MQRLIKVIVCLCTDSTVFDYKHFGEYTNSLYLTLLTFCSEVKLTEMCVCHIFRLSETRNWNFLYACKSIFLVSKYVFLMTFTSEVKF